MQTPCVIVKVYVVVVRGDAVGLNKVVDESVPPLFQEGVPDPLPLSTAVLPAQIEISPPAFTVGDEFTIIVKLTGAPTHPLALGVTTKFAVIGLEVVFVAVNAGTDPLPDRPKPILVLLFVQL